MNKNEAIDQFIFMMEYRNLSPNTVSMYSWYLKNFLDFFDSKPVEDLDVFDAQAFIIHLKDSYAPASLNAVISGIRYFYDVVLNNALSRRQFPNILYDPVEINIFTKEQVHALLDTKDVRLRAFLLLGLDAGLRVGEVARLKVKDIDSQQGLISIHESKRGKSRKVPLSPSLLTALREYWKVYRPDPQGYLFPTRHSDSRYPHIHQTYINMLFKKHMRQFDFYDPSFRFHNLRDTYATTMLKNGCNIFVLKKLLGHSSFASTARYIKYDHNDLLDAPRLSSLLEIK